MQNSFFFPPLRFQDVLCKHEFEFEREIRIYMFGDNSMINHMNYYYHMHGVQNGSTRSNKYF